MSSISVLDVSDACNMKFTILDDVRYHVIACRKIPNLKQSYRHIDRKEGHLDELANILRTIFFSSNFILIYHHTDGIVKKGIVTS